MLQQTQVATALAYYERFVAKYPRRRGTRRRAARRRAGVVERPRLLQPRASSASLRTNGDGRARRLVSAQQRRTRRVARHRPLDRRRDRRLLLRRTRGHPRRQRQACAGAPRRLRRPTLPTRPRSASCGNTPSRCCRAAADMPVYTQGLMDLGATVCLPRQPRCLVCPLHGDCVARRTGRAAELPLKTRRLRRGARSNALLWLRHRDDVLLVRRPETGVWAGLWSLPEMSDLAAAQAQAAQWSGQGVGAAADRSRADPLRLAPAALAMGPAGAHRRSDPRAHRGQPRSGALAEPA